MRYRFGGLIFGEAYTWRGLFSEFYGISSSVQHSFFVVITIIVESPPAPACFIESFMVFSNSLVITFIKNEKEQE